MYRRVQKIKVTEISKEILSNTDATQLFLNDNNITSIPAEIGNLINLTELSLSTNKITSIPSDIGKLTLLTELSFSRNEITSIPPEIGNLTNLTNLTFLNNKIITIPPEIGKLTNLTKLNFSGNQLTFLPDEIGTLVNLTQLNVSNNQITVLPDSITKLIHLEELLLNNNMLDARVLSTVITLSENLTSPNKAIFSLSIIDNPTLIFPIKEIMKASNERDVVYLTILTHGIIPLDSNNQVIVNTLPPSVNTFEIQRACSLSAVNYVNDKRTKDFESLIKSQFKKPIECSSDVCNFDTEFTKNCKDIEGNLESDVLCSLDPTKPDAEAKRFFATSSLRYPQSKVFKKMYGTKVYYFNNVDYFQKGKDTNDMKIMMYIKREDSILSFDITQYVIGRNSQLLFFQNFLHFVVNGSTEFSGTYNKAPYMISIEDIITFLNTVLGYKNIKIADFSCGVFAKEEDIKNYKINKIDYLTDDELTTIASQLEPHYGGKQSRRKQSRRKQSRRKQSRRKQSRRKQSRRKNKK